MSDSGSDLPQPPSPLPAEPVVVDPATQEVLGVVSEYVFEHFFSGPLPPPEALAEYDRVLPGLAREIVESWGSEGEHRRSLEKAIVRSRITLQRRGQLIGALVCLIVLGAGIALIAIGESMQGLIGLLAPLAVLAGVFVYGESRPRRGGSSS